MSESAATAALRALHLVGALKRERGLVVYRCRFGDHWHFGH